MNPPAAPPLQPFAVHPVTPRPAATVVVMRAGTQGAGPDVLMLQRSGKADFASGMYVFPGGGVEAEDLSAAAAQLSPRLSPGQAQGRLVDAATEAQALGYHVTALRETFEECGILLVRTPEGAPVMPGPALLEAGRKASTEGGTRLNEWLIENKLAWATEDLIYFAHWITPKAVPKRFDTRFFLAEVHQDAQVTVDGAEIVGYRWTTPERAIAEHAAGQMPMIDPTLRNLEVLQAFPSVDAARRALAERPVRKVMPQIKTLPDGKRLLIFPWDSAYEADPEPT